MLARVSLFAALIASPALAQETFVVTTTANSGAGSLSQAITDANRSRNAAAGPDRIEFAIPGDGPYTIQPNFELPAVTEAVVLDGLTQPGADCSAWPATLMIELDGQRTGFEGDGLAFESGGGSTVRGLVVNRFQGDGFDVKGSGGNTFECNYVGTDVTGRLARPNGDDGIDVESPGNVIGGPAPSARNLISGNGNDGIDIDGSGVDADGNVLQGNYIGVAVDGTSPLGNDDEGIELQFGASGTLVGGTGPGEGNVIAFNDGNGVKVEASSSVRNSILGNAMFGNGERGIELQEGVRGEQTANDSGDRDSGPNNLQNYPVLTAARTAANTSATTVEGTIDSAPNTTFRIELFANGRPDADGFGPGETFVGALEVATDADGDADFSIALSERIEAGTFVTATATDAEGNTSEFSQGLEVVAQNNVSAEGPAERDRRITLAPNPAGDAVAVSFDLEDGSPIEVVVVDVLGRVVRAQTSRAGQRALVLDVSGVPPGAYVVRVTSGATSRTARFTVAR